MAKKTPHINLSSLGFSHDVMANFDNLPLETILKKLEIGAQGIFKAESESDFNGEAEYPEGNWFGLELVRQLQAESLKQPHLSDVKLVGGISTSKKHQIALEIYCNAGYIRARCAESSTKKKSKGPVGMLSDKEECEQIALRAIKLGLMIAQQDFWKDVWPLTEHGAKFRRAGPTSLRANELIDLIKCALKELGQDKPEATKV